MPRYDIQKPPRFETPQEETPTKKKKIPIAPILGGALLLFLVTRK